VWQFEEIKGKPHSEKHLGYQMVIKGQSVGKDTLARHW
jgi:phosphopentomutase